MFRNTPLANTPTFKLILGFGLCTLGGAMLYAYFKQRDEEEELQQHQAIAHNPKSLQQKTQPPSESKPQKEIKIEWKLKNELVPLIAGRQGANLKSIEDKTQTKIRFR